MLRTAALLFAATTCLAAPASAQSGTVTGVVIDDRTERPIRGVLVYLDDQPAFAETDADGRFSLTIAPGRYSIAASVLGYALLTSPVDVGVNAPLALILRLSEGAGAYTERITVTGDRRGQSADAPGSAALYGRELENLRGVMLDDPLRAVHALPAATATDDFYSEFAVRGSSYRHIGLAIDGIPSRYLMHTIHGVADGGSIAMVNSETLGAVSLLPGSYPQRTGRHLGAQLDLTTREGSRDGFRGRAGLSGTSANFLGEGPFAAARGSWLVSVRRSYLDYLIQRIEPDASFAFGFTDAQAKAVYDVTPRHQLTVTTLLGRAAFDEAADDLGDNDEADATSHAWLTSIAWRFLPGTRFALTQRLYTTGLEFDNRNRVGTTLNAARFTDVGWRADGSFAPATGWLVEFGGDLQQLSGRSTTSRTLRASTGPVTLNDYTETTSAASAYAQVRVAVGSRLSVTPGARIDRSALTASTSTSPWVNAELRVSRRTGVRAGGGIYRQFADLDQVFGLRGGGRALSPERAIHADAGVEHSVTDDTRLLVTLYSRRERDVLWTPDSEPRRLSNGTIRPGFADAPWVNTLEGRARGVEIFLRREAPAGLSGWAGYAYARHRYDQPLTGEAFWADADQRHTVSLYGNYRLSSRTSVSAKLRYGSNYPIVGYIGEEPGASPLFAGDQMPFHGLAGQRNTLRLPAYARLDVRADRAFNWSGRRLVLFVEVANTLNRTNLRNTPYGVNAAGRVFEATESLMPIVPSAGFVIEF